MSPVRVLIATRSTTVCRCGDISGTQSVDTKSVDYNWLESLVVALDFRQPRVSIGKRMRRAEAGLCDIPMSAGLNDALARARCTPRFKQSYGETIPSLLATMLPCRLSRP